jgi:DNA-binding GntR family transcriptional regulator
MRKGRKAHGQLLLARQILVYVFEQKLAQGHHLVETALADRFEVSRTLVRAALKHLADKGIVEPRRNQGYFLCKSWDQLNERVISVPPLAEDDLYRRIVQDRIAGRIPERITQVALINRYATNRNTLLRVLTTMAEEGIVTKNKGHGWTFLPAINTAASLRSSYDFRRTLEPNGILLASFRVDQAALQRIRFAHVALLALADTAQGPDLFQLDAEFHEMIASFTNNSFFVQAVQQQNRLRRLVEYRGYENRRRVRVWVGEHLAVIEALQAGDHRLAAQLMDQHLEKAHRNAIAISESRPSRGGRMG